MKYNSNNLQSTAMKRVCKCCQFWERLLRALGAEEDTSSPAKQKKGGVDTQKNAHPIVRNFKSMYTIANMLDL